MNSAKEKINIDKKWLSLAVELCEQLVVYYWKLVLNLNGAINLLLCCRHVGTMHSSHMNMNICVTIFICEIPIPTTEKVREREKTVEVCTMRFQVCIVTKYIRIFALNIHETETHTIFHRLKTIFANIPKRH